jgi:hypothetical protein
MKVWNRAAIVGLQFRSDGTPPWWVGETGGMLENARCSTTGRLLPVLELIPSSSRRPSSRPGARSAPRVRGSAPRAVRSPRQRASPIPRHHTTDPPCRCPGGRRKQTVLPMRFRSSRDSNPVDHHLFLEAGRSCRYDGWTPKKAACHPDSSFLIYSTVVRHRKTDQVGGAASILLSLLTRSRGCGFSLEYLECGVEMQLSSRHVPENCSKATIGRSSSRDVCADA